MPTKNADTAQLRAAVEELATAVGYLVLALRVANTESVERFEVGRSISRASRSVDLARQQLNGGE